MLRLRPWRLDSQLGQPPQRHDADYSRLTVGSTQAGRPISAVEWMPTSKAGRPKPSPIGIWSFYRQRNGARRGIALKSKSAIPPSICAAGSGTVSTEPALPLAIAPKLFFQAL